MTTTETACGADQSAPITYPVEPVGRPTFMVRAQRGFDAKVGQPW